QGIILGTFVQGFDFTSPGTVLPLHDWLHPFNVFCALALVVGYALLGANRLIDKTIGNLQAKCFKLANIFQYIIFLAAIIASVWSPFLDVSIKERWFNPAHMPYLAILPLLTLVCFAIHGYALKQRRELLPFWSSIGIFTLCYAGFIISCYPYLVPRQI